MRASWPPSRPPQTAWQGSFAFLGLDLQHVTIEKKTMYNHPTGYRFWYQVLIYFLVTCIALHNIEISLFVQQKKLLFVDQRYVCVYTMSKGVDTILTSNFFYQTHSTDANVSYVLLKEHTIMKLL